ncbi:MAG: DUF1592 domain-containing protein [Myxococcaceae bacterium]
MRSLLLLLALTACGRSIPPAPPAVSTIDAGPDVVPSATRRLTRLEYDSTVRDLLGITSAPGFTTFPPDEETLGYDDFSDTQAVSPLLAERYLDAAEAIAAQVDPRALAHCGPGDDDVDCLIGLLGDFGARAWRRPLSAAERDALVELFGFRRLEDDSDTAFRTVIVALLTAPQFLYRLETDGTGTRALDPYEQASRLSYFLYGSMPDEPLLAAAASDALGTPDELEAQATRMLKDPRAAEAVARFGREWLGVAHLLELPKANDLYTDFQPLAPKLRLETDLFLQWVFLEGGTADQLLDADFTFADPELAMFYGLTPPQDSSFAKLDTTNTLRTGVLTQGSVLSAWSKADQTSPVLRGKLVRTRFLCQELPPPPGNVPNDLAPVTDGTTRERFEAHLTNPNCSGCHQLIDPVGFGLERYDAEGHYRIEENGELVRDDGTLINSGDAALDGPFTGAVPLSQKIAQSPAFRSCLVKQTFRYAFGRPEGSTDAAALADLGQQFDVSGARLDRLLLSIVRSDAFRTHYEVTK